jgi:hypothetical protein
MFKRLSILCIFVLALLPLAGCGSGPGVPTESAGLLITGSISFPSTAVNTAAAAQTISLSNPGSAALSISGITITGTNAGDFAETNTCGTTLAAGDNCSISIVFTPAAVGNFTASLSVADNATDTPDTATLQLTGTGVPAPAPLAVLIPSSLSLPNTAATTSASPQTITLSNSGTAPLNISAISITGANPTDFTETNNCGGTLAVNATCTISVTFSPQSAAIFSGGVSVTDNAAGLVQTAALTGVGTAAPAPAVALIPTSLNLPSTAVNSISAAQTITVLNSGTSPLSISGISVTGANPSDFAETSNCSNTLAVNATCTISVTFSPQSVASFAANISIADNAAGSVQTAMLTGTGIAVPAPMAVLTPSSLSMPTTTVNATSTAQMITLTNPGTATLNITGIAITGANATDFTQANTCGSTLLVNSSCEISVTFTPQAAAAFSASISVADNANGSTQMAALTGTGIVAALDPIPLSFYGFTVNTGCDISNERPTNQALNCDNPENHSMPGLPFAWSRSLGSSTLKWSDLVQCDPTGSVCPVAGHGCDKNGIGANGVKCSRSFLYLGCQPNLKLPTDPTNCAYYWTQFDFFTQLYNASNVDWMYTLTSTPDYLSVEGSRCTGVGIGNNGPDVTCAFAANPNCAGTGAADGQCAPPYDLDSIPGNGDGQGSDQNLINFLTAFMTHLAINSEHIKYMEIWNEPSTCQAWNHSDGTQNCGTPATGAVASAGDLARIASDARALVHQYDPTVLITSPPTAGGTSSYDYMQTILTAGSSQYDLVGFHGYDILPIPGGAGACPSLCPVPEYLVSEWAALKGVLSALNLTSMKAINTEFSWGGYQNVTIPDMRSAQAARLYILQESFYPELQRVGWYGEDFPLDGTPNPNNPGYPDGGTGEFWASSATNIADGCTVGDPIQGGYDCPAGLAMQQVEKWTLGATFSGPCTCSTSPNGGSCAATPPAGVWQCAISKPGGYSGLFVWDNTYATYPCPTTPTSATAPCGSGTFTVPSTYSADWQDLTGHMTVLHGATSVTIGGKPILLENEAFP